MLCLGQDICQKLMTIRAGTYKHVSNTLCRLATPAIAQHCSMPDNAYPCLSDVELRLLNVPTLLNYKISQH